MKLKDLLNDKVLTISNLLSLLRIVIAPILSYFIVIEKREGDLKNNIVIVICLVIIVLSDFLDGYLARLLGRVSKLGQFLDPVADKISSLFVGFFLCVYKGFPVWLYALALGRELFVLVGGLFMFSQRDIEVKPNIFGKMCMVSFSLAGILYIFDINYTLFRFSLKSLSIFLIVLFYLLGGILYIKTYARDWFETKE